MNPQLESVGGLGATAVMLCAAVSVVLLRMVSRLSHRRAPLVRSPATLVAPRAATRDSIRPSTIAIGILALAGIMFSVAACSGSDQKAGSAAGAARAETTPTGSFTDSITIDVPAFHGIEPDISLDYDSNNGNSEIGTGWNLKAGSRIVRKGTNEGIPRYDGTDIFKLDGIELVACTPNCVTGGTHETQQQSYARIVFDGTKWTMWRPNGVKMIYESLEAAPADAYEWLLTQVIDTHGNTVTYEHDCPNHCFFTKITYGATTAACGGQSQPECKAGAEIRFYLEQRPDVPTYPTGRTTRQVRQRVRSISVRMDNTLVAAYRLKYDQSGLTGNSVLRTVQQFAGDATVGETGDNAGIIAAGATPPMPPTTLKVASSATADAKWTLAPSQTSGPFSTTAAGANHDFPVISMSVPGDFDHYRQDETEISVPSPLLGDFDGDRRTDVAAWRVPPLHTCSVLQTQLASLTSGHLVRTDIPSELHGGLTGNRCPRTGYVTDLNADGADDILMMNAWGWVARAISNRDGTFSIEKAYYQSPPWKSPFPGSIPAWKKKPKKCTTGDFNGDQLGDIACLYSDPSAGKGQLGIILSDSEASDGWRIVDTELPATVTVVPELIIMTAGDVDASTTSDIMLAFPTSVAPGPIFGPVRLITGYTAANGNVASWSSFDTTWSAGSIRLNSADIDADARSDYVVIDSSQNLVHMAFSEKTADGSTTLDVRRDMPIPAQSHIAIGDVDGDGRNDLITGSNAGVGVISYKGDGIFSGHQAISSNGACPTDPDVTAYAADFNGDGQADLVCQSTSLDKNHYQQFDLSVQPSPVVPPGPTKWRVFDKNGDGREDLYAVMYRNPGYEVYTLIAKPGGGYTASHDFIAPQADAPYMNDPDTSRWMAADVGSPAGTPDGRSDLIRVSRDVCAKCPGAFRDTVGGDAAVHRHRMGGIRRAPLGS